MTAAHESEVYAIVREGIALREAGKHAEAQNLLNGLVDRVVSGHDGFAKVFLAHSLADLQEDPHDELSWDLRALDFMDEVTDERAAEQGVPGGRDGLLPSLHLNLAVSYRRVGDDLHAAQHFVEGSTFLAALGDDEYSIGIKRDYASGLDAHIEQLAQE